MAHRYVESPIDGLLLHGEGDTLVAIDFGAEPVQDETSDVLEDAAAQLQEYFAGERREFDLPLAARGTAFQQRVWAALAEIPYGQTMSYGQVAARLGLVPGASRAIGSANGSNPIPIVVPCHRVIGANGTLTGFGGGIDRKRTLLALESPGLF
ncbi:MAG: methylated-DNA--[protein]-cysteine S-methyltransferase [Nocardioidaceae bacterium]|nr:methylated-DNA--[protein]-cysteine S-methyltransferase [Nocardioidaceae bacterium]